MVKSKVNSTNDSAPANFKRTKFSAFFFSFLFVFVMALVPLSASAQTVMDSNTTAGTADGDNFTRDITFDTSDFPSNATITDVTIELDFSKIDDSGGGVCGPPPMNGTEGSTFNNEIDYELTSPDATIVSLVEQGSSYSGTTFPDRVQVTLDDAAGSGLSGTPTTGTFQPHGTLGDFDGEDPLGTWSLRVRDILAGDPHCFYEYTLTVTATAPGPQLQSFTSTTMDDTYGPTETINITATYDTDLGMGSTMTVQTDTGVAVVLNNISGNELSGTYTVGATGSGQNTMDLSVASITSQNTNDGFGNTNTGTGLPATNIDDGSDIQVDTTAPTVNEKTAVPDPTNDGTPDYEFSSTENGTIAYGGDCESATGNYTGAPANLTVTLSENGGGGADLSDGTHSNCTITVTDDYGNTSSTLMITSFEVDTMAPTVTEDAAVTDPTNDTTPEYSFNTTEAGTISYGGSCESATTAAVSGDNPIDLRDSATNMPFGEGTYNDCTLTVTDDAGNSSAPLAITSFDIDLTAPTVTQVTAVDDPTNDTTPQYTYNSNEAGTTSYGGSCESADTTTDSGNNTIDLRDKMTSMPFNEGTYNDCTVTVTDAAGNASTALPITSFEIDTTAPGLAETGAVPTPGNDPNPMYSFTSDEAGAITYSPGCDSADTMAVNGPNTITFADDNMGAPLGDGTYDCTITVTDDAGNAGNLDASVFVIDLTPPNLATVTAVPDPTGDNTPPFTFSSDEAGTINYSGSCTGDLTMATDDNNITNLQDTMPMPMPLVDGTYTDCDITVTDAVGNESAVLEINDFEVDTTAPTLNNITAVTPNPTADATPDYTFNSNEDGTITYDGGCESATANYTMAPTNLTVTFINPMGGGDLDDGTYDCTITVTDDVGNESAPLMVPQFEVDTTGPQLTEAMAIADPVNDATPDYTFNLDEDAVLLTYGGDCGSADTTATAPSETVTLDDGMGMDLSEGNHTNCTITATDALGNVGNTLMITGFEVDTIAPTLNEEIAVTDPTNDATPDYRFSSNEAGTITYMGAGCNGTPGTAINGNTDVVFDSNGAGMDMPDGTYNCTIRVTDDAGNFDDLTVTQFEVDTEAPTLTEAVQVTNPTADATPDYQFDSSEDGTLTFLDTCQSVTTMVSATPTMSLPNTTIALDSNGAGADLPDGFYSCRFTVTDDAGNTSAPLTINDFNVDTTGPTIMEVTPVTDPTNDGTPDWTFEIDEDGSIAVSGTCDTATMNVSKGSMVTITLDKDGAGGDLDEITHNTCTIQATDALGNVGPVENITSFEVDLTAPTVTEQIMVPTPDNDTTPPYTFNSTENGTITYGGGCGSTTTNYTGAAADLGIDFTDAVMMPLAHGTYDCTITVTDAAGNASLPLMVTQFEVDIEPPTITTVTAVTDPTNDTTPDYVFDIDEDATLTYPDACKSATTMVTATPTMGLPDITITLDSDTMGGDLGDGTYNCDIVATDAVGNMATHDIPEFEIDTIAPNLLSFTSSTPNGTYGPGGVINVTANYDDPLSPGSSITVTLDTGRIINLNTIGPSTLSGTYIVGITGSGEDSDGPMGMEYLDVENIIAHSATDGANTNSDLTLPATDIDTGSQIIVDTTAPSLAETIAVTTPDNDPTPAYQYSSDEAGVTTVYGGGCQSVTTTTVDGLNNIIFDVDGASGNLPDATYNCTVTTTDAVGNTSDPLTVSPFTIDTTGPTITIFSAVSTPDNDPTPDFTFTSDDAGTFSFVGGSCMSATPTAVIAGNNTITLDSNGAGGDLADGDYTDCDIQVQDALMNPGNVLEINDFEVDTMAPALTETPPGVADPTMDPTPDYTFMSDDNATLAFGGDCESATTNATNGSNTISLRAAGGADLTDGTYTNCTITPTDDAGNMGGVLNISSFEVDTEAATVFEVGGGVDSPTNDPTPDYTFNSDMAGTISYSGSCESGTTMATGLGNQTISLRAAGGADLAEGTFSDCSLTVTDPAGNAALLNITPFEVDLTAPTLGELTAVPTITSDTTPQYIFTSDEEGTISFNMGCGTATTNASVGNNIIDLGSDGTGAAFTDGLQNCTLTVTDAAGNADMQVVTAFTVDTTPPTLDSLDFDGTGSDTYGPGENINLEANYNETIGAGSQILVVLNNGKMVTLNNVTGTRITGTYTVGAAGSGEDVTDLSVSSILLQDAKDTAVTPNANISTTVPGSNLPAGRHVDVTVPTLAEVTPVPDPTNDNTPDYTFNASEGGLLTVLNYSGDCQSATGNAAGGVETITLEASVGGNLGEGTYTNCDIQLVDAAGNTSNTLEINDFTVDTTRPVLQSFTSSTGDGTKGPGTAINLTATYDDTLDPASTIKVDLNNGVTILLNTVVGMTITGTYTVGATGSGEDVTDLTVQSIDNENVTDDAGNSQSMSGLPATNIDDGSDIDVDTTAATLTPGTPITTPTADQNPVYDFTSDGIGAIAYGGGCNSVLAAAAVGMNNVTFDSDGAGAALADGTYNCTIQVTDAVGNASAVLNVPQFEVAAGLGDADSDTLNDITECPAGPPFDATCPDSDQDGTPDFQDTDSDNDGEDDQTEGAGDADGDGIPDRLEHDNIDTDGDGTKDDQDGDDDSNGDIIDNGDGDDTSDECPGGVPCPDADGDNIPDHLDGDSTNVAMTADGSGDSDGDGISDTTECPAGYICPDTDGDMVPDYMDGDSDDDGEKDATECTTPLNCEDAEGDGVPDFLEPDDQDVDNDGVGNDQDGDDDGDAVPTSLECAGGIPCADADGDGIPTFLDPDEAGPGAGDSDFDGNPDDAECPLGIPCPDTDGDGIPNYTDTDSDGDGTDDNVECTTPLICEDDGDGDGIYDYLESDQIDSDGDGDVDQNDADSDDEGAGDLAECPNSPACGDVDGDGIPSHLDGDETAAPDSGDTDGDGIDDDVECPTGVICADTDGDGIPDYADTDSDGDGSTDAAELADGDTDADGIPDYLESDQRDSDGDGLTDERDDNSNDAGNPGADDNTQCGTFPDCVDGDGDGIPTYLDGDETAAPLSGDTDGDTITDAAECPNGVVCPDTDGDLIPDFADLDSDGDGSKDFDELADGDSDGDGIPDYLESDTVDSDGDGLVDELDDNSNDPANPGADDSTECTNAPVCEDADGDGIPSFLDGDEGGPGAGDTDGDGWNDDVECPGGVVCADTDGDSIPDYADTDSDGDGTLDALEIGDDDADLLPNYLESDQIDSDGDGVVDQLDNNANDPVSIVADDGTECGNFPNCVDGDGDGIPTHLDGDETLAPAAGDTDADNIADDVECSTGVICNDEDADGIPDYADTDSDGDGIDDVDEGVTDPDGDMIPSYLDDDSDGDGISDADEGGADSDGDGTIDSQDTDSDNDGILDADEGDGDFDGDGTPDYLDDDADNDGIDDIDEGNADTDGDGLPDNTDIDADGDGLVDGTDAAPAVLSSKVRPRIGVLAAVDTDSDLVPNSKDIDSDGDGISDNIESQTIAGFTPPSGLDTDGDGLDNAYDPDNGGTTIIPLDFDGDGTADYLDNDTDADGIADIDEAHDTDGDLVPDRTQVGNDTDGDGLDDGFDTINGHGTTTVIPNPFWRNSSPFECTDLSETLSDINTAANKIKNRFDLLLRIRDAAASTCGLTSNATRSRRVKRKARNAANQIEALTSALPSEDETNCELGTCSNTDATASKAEMTTQLSKKLRRRALNQIAGTCVTNAGNAAGFNVNRQRRFVRNRHKAGKAAIDSYPDSPLVCN